jgi:hypothetical protein
MVRGDMGGRSDADWERTERNYEHSPYVAEFWNTLSSLALVALALVGASVTRQMPETRWSASWLMMVIIGVGEFRLLVPMQVVVLTMDGGSLRVCALPHDAAV